MPAGYLAIVLHAHLPFVRHPEYDFFLEEDWLYEAITETYLPLIHLFDQLVELGVPFRLTMSLTPTLTAMLSDDMLQSRYRRRLHELIELAGKEVERTRLTPAFHYLATMYRARFEVSRAIYEDRYGCNLLKAFRRFQDLGVLEILTCGATHGFLPLLQVVPQAVRAQIQVAVQHHTHHFGRPPQGIWLPECGYYPGLDRYLREFNIRFFFTEAHGLLYATPRPRFGNYAPIYCPATGVAAFGRDRESANQVWDARHGYPGDYLYREFYRDIGYDLEQDYIGPYVQPDGQRKNTGIKYYRITGKTNRKHPYNPEWASEKTSVHANDFMGKRQAQIRDLNALMAREAIVVSPYDAELFGHWWFEGPEWLKYVMLKSVFDQDTYELITPSAYLERHPTQQVATPAASSWGAKGYYNFWCNQANDWIYPHLHRAAERMVELAYRFPETPHPLLQRALNQAARELLLAQSSDWAFIMSTGTMVDYAVKRTKNHLGRFTKIYTDLLAGRVEEEWLAKIEYLDNLFPLLDYRVYR